MFNLSISGSAHALSDKVHVAVDKTDDTVVVFRVGIAYATALDYFQCLQVHLYSLNVPSANRSRKDKGVFFEVVSIRPYTVVLMFSFA